MVDCFYSCWIWFLRRVQILGNSGLENFCFLCFNSSRFKFVLALCYVVNGEGFIVLVGFSGLVRFCQI
jgi:hypothetical protein